MVLNMDPICLVWKSLKTQQQFNKQSSVNSYMKLPEFINKNIKTQFCISQQVISKGKIANESNIMKGNCKTCLKIYLLQSLVKTEN